MYSSEIEYIPTNRFSMSLLDYFGSNRMLFEFLPDKFTIGELESVYKAIFNITDRVPNFRRMIQKYVIETPIMTNKKQSFRPAKLYIRNYQMF